MEWLSFLGLEGVFTAERVLAFARAAITVLIGLFIAQLASRGIAKLVGKQASPQQTMLAKRLSFYVLVSLVVISVLGQLGFNLRAWGGSCQGRGGREDKGGKRPRRSPRRISPGGPRASPPRR